MQRYSEAVKHKKSYRFVFWIFILVWLVIAVFSFQYYQHLQKAITEESKDYLQEISKGIGSNITRMIDDNYASLNIVASLFDNCNMETFQDIKPILKTQQQYWDSQDLLLIDKDGKAYNMDGIEVPIGKNSDFDNAVVNKKESISTAQVINNQESILLMVPIDDKEIDGKTIVSMVAVYAPSTFEETLSMASFDGRATSCIITKEGTNVVRAANGDLLKLGYNVFASIGSEDEETRQNVAKVKEQMNQNVSGQMEFTKNQYRYYLIYTPINPEEWYLLTFVPSSVVNQKSDVLLRLTLFLCSIIAVIFAVLIAFISYIFLKQKNKLEQIAYVDETTGGNTIRRFYELASVALGVPEHPQYVLIYTNFQKFKVLNEQLGKDNCDSLLRAFYNTINDSLYDKECMGRISADNFCVLLEYTDEKTLLQRFGEWYGIGECYIEKEKPVWGLPIVEFGVYIVDNDLLPFPQIIDRAKLALRDFAKAVNSKVKYAIYDDAVHQRLFREKQLEDMMENALKQKEFKVFLQPKYCADNKKIGGAEALTRWISETEGMIFPDEFIPLFEKNGFIIQLDLFIFEEVCKKLRSWIDEGLKPVKISVNCSRVQLRDKNFLLAYKEIIEKYDVPSELIEIELTESVVMEDSERLVKVISEIHELGFGCSMDDFGSGYSSLNMIQSIPVDTLKLDKIFFKDNDQDPERMKSVVGSIVTMAKALSMVTVAEGVEHPEQVEMLASIGCNYIQGYVFAKPMPISDFEKLAFDKKIE